MVFPKIGFRERRKISMHTGKDYSQMTVNQAVKRVKDYSQMTVNQAVKRVLTRHFDDVTTVAFVLVLARLFMLSPFIISPYVGGYLPSWMLWIISGALYIFMVMPLRYWGREKVRRRFYTRNLPTRQHSPYIRWLKTGLLRLGRALLWGLPFVLCLGYYLIGKSTLPVNDMWKPLRPLARLIGREPDTATGMLIGLALLLLFGLLFAYGWWRDLPFEYLPARSLGRKHTLHWSRRIMKSHRGSVAAVTLVNALLCIPAVAGAAAVMIPYVLENVDFSLSKNLVVNLVLRLLKTPLPAKQLMALGAVALFLYLPLCGLRKMRNAALIAKYMREDAPHHHHQDSAEGGETPEKKKAENNNQQEDPDGHAAG